MPYSLVIPVLSNDIVCMCKYSPETNCQRAGHDRHPMTKLGTELVWGGAMKPVAATPAPEGKPTRTTKCAVEKV